MTPTSALSATTTLPALGATVLPSGKVRFVLWAPDAKEVALVLTDANQTLPMTRTPDGYFTLDTAEAKPGTRYQYQINGDLKVPDPASRYQPDDIHGPSQVIDPAAYRWRTPLWCGRPWEEAILYEIHVGTFTPEGTFAAVIDRLDHLQETGITAIELLPVSDFPGTRNWGYDGVLPFAPDSSYGRPEDLKALVDAAHERGIMVFMDVVYNHFGPEGNYLHAYAKQFFTEKHQTPWGAAINYDDAGSEHVRHFMIANALYWLDEYHMDGLRLDAVHAIEDTSARHFLTEFAETIHQHFDRSGRHIHLVLENDKNEARFLERDSRGESRWFTAQWNDDIHHALHTLISGESTGYYSDYANAPAKHLARCLSEGFAYQNEPSPFRDGEVRGEVSKHLPPTAFISFIQNHDQIGNRAFGDRILPKLGTVEAVKTAAAVYLLAPSIPMLYMGEEYGSERPFPFFCDFKGELAQAVTEGRRKEFAKFPEFSDPATRESIPDPNDEATFQIAKMDFRKYAADAKHSQWYVYYKEVLQVRHSKIIPLLKTHKTRIESCSHLLSDTALEVEWIFTPHTRLSLMANFGKESVACPVVTKGLLFASNKTAWAQIAAGQLPAETAVWYIQDADHCHE